jgi:hypothetical protein
MDIQINGIDHLHAALKDLDRFNSLTDWLLAIKNKEVAFDPQYCAVRINREWLNVVNGGTIAPNIDTVIDKVKSLPPAFGNLPNKYMGIDVNLDEKELFFNTNYVID